MKRVIPVLLSVGCVMGFFSQCLAGDEGEFAPPDAFIDGSSHPYYGSGNPWNRRFFGEIDKNGKLLLHGGDLRLYGRRGQRQMLDILEGRVDDARDDEFDIEVQLAEFKSPRRRTSPLGKELVKWWCFTVAREAELEITGVELLGPE